MFSYSFSPHLGKKALKATIYMPLYDLVVLLGTIVVPFRPDTISPLHRFIRIRGDIVHCTIALRQDTFSYTVISAGCSQLSFGLYCNLAMRELITG